MIEIYTDGACAPTNPGKMGIGVVVYKDGRIIDTISKALGDGTSNQAELYALQEALLYAKNNSLDAFTIKGDSKLAYFGTFGKWRISHPNIMGIAQQIKALLKNFKSIDWYVIPREYNEVADELSTRGLPPSRWY